MEEENKGYYVGWFSSAEKTMRSANPRPSTVNHAVWLLLVAGLTIEMGWNSSGPSLLFSGAWVFVGLILFPVAITGSCRLLRNCLMVDAAIAMTILSLSLFGSLASVFETGILAGQAAFAVYLAHITNRQLLEYKRLEILHATG